MTDKRTSGDLFGNTAGAAFDQDGKYRYDLYRMLQADNDSTVLFVMLNPSTADHVILDPTVTRCKNFAILWGFGSFHVANMFALVSSNPKALETAEDPVGPLNGQYIARLAKRASKVIVAWGAHKLVRQRQKHVLKLLYKYHEELYCLGYTKKGYPRHPLYVSNNTELVLFHKLRNEKRN